MNHFLRKTTYKTYRSKKEVTSHVKQEEEEERGGRKVRVQGGLDRPGTCKRDYPIMPSLLLLSQQTDGDK